MSWKASAYVKPLTKHSDGSPLTAREKLILFVLADSHNDDYDCAWPGITRAAEQSLTSRRRFIELIKRLEDKDTITVERREGRSNIYRFPGLVQSSHPCETVPVQELHPTSALATAPTRATAIAPKPSESLEGTDIAATSPPFPHYLSEEKVKIRKDYEQRRWQVDQAGKRFLVSPSTGGRIYEKEMQ